MTIYDIILTGDFMEVIINSLDHQGRGIGRINNKVIFIPNTIPGEKVEVKIIKEKKKYMEGIVTKYLEKDKDRIENLCQYYPKCGGCQLLHIPYQQQLLYKEDKVKNIFKRYNLENVKINSIIGSPSKYHYRNKVTFHVSNQHLGYYQENSNKFIKIDSCLLLCENINKNFKNILPNNDKLIIRSNNHEITYEQNKKIMHTIVDYKFLVSIDSFYQVNDYITPLLYNKVKEYLNPTKQDTVLDLYCGTGTIGIFISKEVNNVIGIEINEQAIEDAKENAKLNNIKNITLICGDAGFEAKKLKIKPTSIIVDPPRAGLNKEAIETIIKFNPNKIIYVSCDPMTLVRDLNILKKYYNIIEVTPFDMFPNTYHVECVCLLSLR